jgi:bifunctional non-homologous end joining protein LigD
VAHQRKKRVLPGKRASYPGFIEPILAEQVDRPPRGDRWVPGEVHGYRAQLHLIHDDRKVGTAR